MKPHVLLFFCFALFLFQPIMASGAEPYMQFGDTGIIYDAEYSPDGTMIAVGTSTGFQIMDAFAYDRKHIQFTEESVRIVKWFPDSNRLFVVLDSFSGEILESRNTQLKNISNKHLIYNLETARVENEFNLPIYWIGLDGSPFNNFMNHKNSIGMSSNSSIIVSMQDRNIVNVFDLNSNELVTTIESQDLFFSIGVSSNPNIIWVGTSANKILIYDMINFSQINQITLDTQNENALNVMTYSPENQYAISLRSKYFIKVTPSFIENHMFYHDFKNMTTVELSESVPLLTGDFPIDVFYHTNSSRNLIINNRTFNDNIGIVNLLEQTDRILDLKENIQPTYFTQPFSTNGELYLTHGMYKPTTDLFTTGALSSQSEIRILPQTPQPTVFDFHPTNPDTLLVYSTNQNTKEQSNLELWDVDSKSLISSTTSVVMYERGEFSQDGSLFITLDQPFEADPNRLNVFDQSGLTPDLQLNLFETDTWNVISKIPLGKNSDGIKYLSFINNDEEIVYSFDATFVKNIDTGEIVNDVIGKMNTIDFSRGHQKLYGGISLGIQGVIVILDLNSNEVKIITLGQSNIRYIHRLSNDRFIAIDKNGLIGIYTNEFETLLSSFGGEMNDVSQARLTPNEKYLIIDNQIWDFENGEYITTYINDTFDFKEIRVSPNSRWFATEQKDGVIRVWDLEALAQQATAVDAFEQY